MRKSLSTSLAVGLSLLAALPLSAQSVVHVTSSAAPGGGNVTAFGYYMSPYSGTLDGGSALRFNCVDFFHDINIGDSWTVNVVNIGAAISDLNSLSVTRNGESGQHPSTPSGLLDVLKIYEAAAWLTTQIPTNPASNPNASTAIQTAMWYFASEYGAGANYADKTNQYWNNGAATSSLVNNDIGSTGYWVDQANAFVAANANNVDYYSQFNILAPTTGRGQEFVYATPEPATLTLMATGLIGLAGFSMRRRRRGAASEPLLS